MTLVCDVDGVPVAQTKMGRWVHVDSLPDDVDGHDVRVVVAEGDWIAVTGAKDHLAVVAAEMLQHHNALHPPSDCEFAKRLEAVLRSPRT